jgi:glutamate--cysteine ligase catalytic subunit
MDKKQMTRGIILIESISHCLLFFLFRFLSSSVFVFHHHLHYSKKGLLKLGTPKSWEDSKKDLTYIRHAGVRQFISTYHRVRDLKGDELLWGDEIEYGVFHLDHEQKKVRLCLRATQVRIIFYIYIFPNVSFVLCQTLCVCRLDGTSILTIISIVLLHYYYDYYYHQIMDDLNEKESINTQLVEGCKWVPEFGSWMVEATPNRPYTGYTTDLLRVERNMRLRRKRLLTVLQPNVEVAPTMSAFPMLGAMGNDGSVPPSQVGGPRAMSEYISDDVINPHPRFGTIARNIRNRRGEKVNIRVPLFRDVQTVEFKDFERPHGDVDGCCGSDAQQVNI